MTIKYFQNSCILSTTCSKNISFFFFFIMEQKKKKYFSKEKEDNFQS